MVDTGRSVLRNFRAQACVKFQVDADGAAQPRRMPTTFDRGLVTGATSGVERVVLLVELRRVKPTQWPSPSLETV